MANSAKRSYQKYQWYSSKMKNNFNYNSKSVASSQQEQARNGEKLDNFVSNLTDSQREQTLHQIKIAKARNSYEDYLKLVYPDFVVTPFHHYLAKLCQTIVQRVERANMPNATLEDKKKGRIKILLSVPPQHGKLLANDTPILTNEGWKKHGDLVVGDKVYNHKGELVKVTHIFPKQYANRKVTFTNGETILCHENHEWLVYDRFSHKEVVRETKFIEENVDENDLIGRGHRFRFQLPLRDYIKGNSKELKVNPYVLGVWLGDGTNRKPCICACKEDDITLRECEKIYRNTKTYIHKTTGVITMSFEGLNKDLHNYGMCYYTKTTQKYIPSDYLTASIEQRLELLAGLLDTDGHLDRTQNRYVFVTADKKLKETFEELVATFGWRTTTYEAKPTISSSGIIGKKVYWQIAFNPTFYIPCRIARKQLHTYSKQRKISICKVEKIDNIEGNCIEVEGGIYLCGKTMIPTHNSQTITKTLPSWYIGRNPTRSAILTAYNAEMGEKFNDSNRQKIRMFGKEVFGVTISDSQDNKGLFELRQGGSCMGVGIQGGITGNGGDIIIVDDPYKNGLEANSPATRKIIEDMFRDSVLTRLRGNGNALIVIHTRWHESDLCGVYGKEDGWIVINIPCVCENKRTDPLHREVGETLCPELGFDAQKIAEIRKNIGEKLFQALYQGHPFIDGGEIFTRKMIQFYTKASLPEKFDEMVMSCDLSFGGKKQSNDPCAIQIWGRNGANHYLLKRIKKRLTFNEMCDTIKIVSASYPQCRKKIVEKKANGQAVIDSLNNVIGGFEAYDPKMNDKQSRANSVTPYFESGNVFLPDVTIDPTIEEMVDEMMKFPNGEHDDEVDAMTQYLTTYSYKNGNRIETESRYITFANAIRGY